MRNSWVITVLVVLLASLSIGILLNRAGYQDGAETERQIAIAEIAKAYQDGYDRGIEYVDRVNKQALAELKEKYNSEVAYNNRLLNIIFNTEPIYIDRPVETKVPYPVEKVVFRDIIRPTTDFQSLEEFQQFVDSIGTVVIVDWYKGFSIDWKTMTVASPGSCYEAALYYWQRAYKQGKRVYLQSVEPAEYNAHFTKRIQPYYEGHIVISAVIGRQLYWVDPASAEVILRGELLK